MSKCIGDGGTCGLGGYCDKCPHVDNTCQQHEESTEHQLCICVPTVELEKLEKARVALYEYLTGRIPESELLLLTNITGQIWRVANTKKW